MGKTSKTPKTVAKKAAKGKGGKKFSKTYKEMIKDILVSSDDRKGLSAHALKAHIKDVFHNDVVARLFNKALKGLVSGSSVTKKKRLQKGKQEELKLKQERLQRKLK